MSPLGKDTEFAARMCSTQPSLGPSGGVKATVTLSFFFDKVSGPACFLSSILGAGNWAPRGALIHGEHVPGGFAPHVMCVLRWLRPIGIVRAYS